MSNETKEKVNMDPAYIIKLTVTLCITCVIVAGLLGLVNSVTCGPIADINAQKTAEAMSQVVSGNPTGNEAAITDEIAAAAKKFGKISNAYEIDDGSHAFKVVASGSQGNIEMMVGVGADGVVSGVSIVSNSETSGIGSRVMANENGVLDQFKGKSAADGELVVGANVDAISGATVSSKGVTAGVNAALTAAGMLG